MVFQVMSYKKLFYEVKKLLQVTVYCTCKLYYVKFSCANLAEVIKVALNNAQGRVKLKADKAFAQSVNLV